MAETNTRLLRRLRLILWGLVVVVGIGATALYFLRPPERPIGLFGGEFTLETTQGQAFTQNDLIGVPTLVYFGYTFCPDVCPTTLAEAMGWMETLKAGPDDLRLIMVTVDPERDTAENLRAYLDAFSEDFVGLVGSLEQTEAAKKAFGVFSQKVKTDEYTDYLVDHTASVFLLDRNGRFEGTIAFGEDSETALAKIRRLIGT
ncbi:MAG: SCO family protein [Alphaproteobacteria bacterium]|nr:SCO family protein [Alphaproteobacteria bacterium]